MNVNTSGNVNNTNAWNANTYAPIVLRRALWPTHSAGCLEDYRQGAEIPGISLNNTADNRKRQHVTPREPASAEKLRTKQYERLHYKF